MSKRANPASRAASNRTPRSINSNLVLMAVRKLQPISRVDLARNSGLQPSTVSLIVDDLLREGWLVEGETVKGAMGRRPTLISLSPRRCVIALDVHPKRTALAVVDISGTIASQTEIDLPEDPAKAILLVARAVKAIRDQHPDRTFEGIGMCLPGRTDHGAKELVFAPNLRWPMMELRDRLERSTGLPVHMDNVANACALLEVLQARTQEQRDVVVVEVSEGLGTGIFVNGAIARGAGGMAGEFGHIPMTEDGPLCSCGNHGCWEVLASNRAFLRYYGEITRTRKPPTFEQAFKLAMAGDPPARKALQRTATHLGRGLQMVAAALAPFEIVIVGDITDAWGEIEGTVMRELRKHTLARDVTIRPSYDGAATRLRSAVALVLADRFTSSGTGDRRAL